VKRLTARRKAEIEQLVKDHLALVEPIARRVAGRLPISVELDDMIQEGRIGLMQAAQRYDAGTGVPFHQYAQFRIRGAILDRFRRKNYSYELHAGLPDDCERGRGESGGAARVLPQFVDPSPLPSELIDDQRRAEKLRQACTWLSAREQIAVTMWSEGRAYRTIAAACKCSTTWAEVLVRNAQTKLRERLKLAG
jgi:RNA polymerase sigma factor (sigma-70 family)